jgi:hypothetical protein
LRTSAAETDRSDDPFTLICAAWQSVLGAERFAALAVATRETTLDETVRCCRREFTRCEEAVGMSSEVRIRAIALLAAVMLQLRRRLAHDDRRRATCAQHVEKKDSTSMTQVMGADERSAVSINAPPEPRR